MDHLFSYTSTIGMKKGREHMNRQQIRSAIGVLADLFYSEKKNQELAILTMEHYIDDLKMLKDVRTVARELENQQAFSLLAPMKWFDMKAAEEIEEVLKGDVSFRR